MDKATQIAEVISFFRNAFSLVLALALAEALKQFVRDRAPADTNVIEWDKLITLISFLLLIFPFYQGTIRYFSYTYGHTLPQHYSISLMIDSGAFICEAALFFIMSRCLSPLHWKTYYGSVIALLWIDSVWGLVVAKLHQTPIEAWIYLNLCFGAVVGIMLFSHLRLKDHWATTIGFVAVLLRTGLDYYLNWNFYFP